jgi:hypothetical protein
VFSQDPRCQGLCGSQQVDLDPGLGGQLGMARHLLPLVIGQGLAQRCGDAVELPGIARQGEAAVASSILASRTWRERRSTRTPTAERYLFFKLRIHSIVWVSLLIIIYILLAKNHLFCQTYIYQFFHFSRPISSCSISFQL